MSIARYEPFVTDGSHTEIFVEPSDEAKALLRLLPAFVGQSPDAPPSAIRVLRDGLVAPFTQLTFLSFDLQAFLFGVLHTSVVAKLGHLVGMSAVNLFLMAQLSAWTTGAGFDGGAVYAGALLCWYAAVSRDARLTIWWFACVPVVLGLLAASQMVLAMTADSASWWAAPWVGVVASAMLISASHLGEPIVPPRVLDRIAWVPVRTFLIGPPGARLSVPVIVGRHVLAFGIFLMGAVNELWASPRLLPYNVLAVLFRLGYAPELRAELKGRVARALASGNPALDYVGIGGGAILVSRR